MSSMSRQYRIGTNTSQEIINITGLGIQYHQLIWVSESVTAGNVKLEKSDNGVTWSDLIANQAVTSSGESAVTEGTTNFLRVTTSSLSGAITLTYLGNIESTETNVIAIKAKTDNLPSDPADQSAVEAAITAAFAAITPVTTVTGTGDHNSGISGSFSAWVELIASATKDIPANCFNLSGCLTQNGANGTVTIEIGVGSAGNEVTVATWNGNGVPAGESQSFFILVPRKIAAGARVSVRSKTTSGTLAGVPCGFNAGQIA